MGALLPIAAAFFQASSAILDKAILRVRGVDYRIYTGVGFPLLFICTMAIAFVVRPPFSVALLFGTGGVLFAASTVILVVGNLLSYRALQGDEAQELNVVGLVRNIPVILVTGILFADERNPVAMIAAVISALAVLWSHYEHHHFHMRRKTLEYLVWVVLMAPISTALWKTLLYSWHPVSLELARNAILALVFGFFYRARGYHLTPRVIGLLVLTNALTAIAWIFVAYGYQSFGVVYTILLFSLEPFLVYFGALVFLRERFSAKKLAGFLVVLAAILAAKLW